MHLKTFTSCVASMLLTGGVYAQNTVSASSTPSVAAPTTPAPAVAPAAAPAPNQIVYTPRLPSAGELSSAAAAQGLTVERIEQTATQIVAVYKNSGGQLNTVSYQTLPPTSAPASVPTSPPPAVVYESAPRVVYYDYYDPYYYPRVWYPPVSVRLGVGFGYRGGFHRGRW